VVRERGRQREKEKKTQSWGRDNMTLNGCLLKDFSEAVEEGLCPGRRIWGLPQSVYHKIHFEVLLDFGWMAALGLYSGAKEACRPGMLRVEVKRYLLSHFSLEA
jgi:hypothetical protein